MRISDILRHKGSSVVTIEASKTIHDAIGVLNEHHIGAVVVTDQNGAVQGIISERDILRQCAEHCVRLTDSPKTDEACPSLVSDIMTTNLIIVATVSPTEDLKRSRASFGIADTVAKVATFQVNSVMSNG